MACQIVNLEVGMPSVEQARAKLSQALRTAKATRTRCLKVIHGYGSSGKGGAIKADTHRFLLQKKREGFLKEYVKGEEFSPFYESARRAVALEPSLTRDVDYSRGNDGITIVILY